MGRLSTTKEPMQPYVSSEVHNSACGLAESCRPGALAGRFLSAPRARIELKLKTLAGAACLMGFIATACAYDWPQWRGPHRDGVSAEKWLLKEWPKAGPAMVWRVTDIGRGYSTPAIVGDRIYLMGSEGLDNEFVEALSVKDGKKIWTTRLGPVGNPKQQPNFPTARSTPTVDGSFLYALGSDGDL